MITLTVVPSLKDFLIAANISYNVKYGIEDSPFGPVLVAVIDRFLCLLKFLNQVPSDGGADLISRRFSKSVGLEEVSATFLKLPTEIYFLPLSTYLPVAYTYLPKYLGAYTYLPRYID